MSSEARLKVLIMLVSHRKTLHFPPGLVGGIYLLEAQVFGCISPTVTHHVRGDDPQTFGGQERDLIPPS